MGLMEIADMRRISDRLMKTDFERDAKPHRSQTTQSHDKMLPRKTGQTLSLLRPEVAVNTGLESCAGAMRSAPHLVRNFPRRAFRDAPPPA